MERHFGMDELWRNFDAYWVRHPAQAEHEAGVTLYRRTVEVPEAAFYRIVISADCRYLFYLDGKLLGRGPLRGDLAHYHFEEYEGSLTPGKHVFAAAVIVWNGAWRRSAAPWAEMHAGGGFFAAGYAGSERMELPGEWHTLKTPGWRPLAWEESWNNSCLMPAPPMEKIDLTLLESDWATAETPAGEWVTPAIIGRAEFRDGCQIDPDTPWNMIPAPLPPMQEEFTPVKAILSGKATLQDGALVGSFPAGKFVVLLDLGRNQTSFVTICGKGGKGTLRIAYAEKLVDATGRRVSGTTGSIGGYGVADQLVLPGEGRAWKSEFFWYRTGRFVEIEADLPEALNDLRLEFRFCHFAFKAAKKLSMPDDPAAEEVYRTAWHTLLCCAHEHFEDCPYYEQMQYVGDARIEALISYAATGDARLGRHAIRWFANSQLPGGMIQSRYPSNFQQVIPGYSLLWVLMLYDDYCCFGELATVRTYFKQVRFLLETFEEARRSDGLIAPLAGWHFSDSGPGWPAGCADRGENLPDAITNLFYAQACFAFSQMLGLAGEGEEAARWAARRDATLTAVREHCFDGKRFWDAPGRPEWKSLHANLLALLYGAVPEAGAREFLHEIRADKELAPLSLYFSFYLLSAIVRFGTRSELLDALAPWEKLIAQGDTTFPESATGGRSECHAWSAAPAFFLLLANGQIQAAGSPEWNTKIYQ